jgi:hypothetical protein
VSTLGACRTACRSRDSRPRGTRCRTPGFRQERACDENVTSARGGQEVPAAAPTLAACHAAHAPLPRASTTSAHMGATAGRCSSARMTAGTSSPGSRRSGDASRGEAGRRPLDWPWGSARAHADLEPPQIPLSEEHLRAVFGSGSSWRQRYRTYIQAENDEDPPKRALMSSGGRI